MSLDDRDWWREDRRKKAEEYGGDFSLHSKPLYQKHNTTNQQYIIEKRKCPHCRRKIQIRIPRTQRFSAQQFQWTCPNCHRKIKSWRTWAKIFWFCVLAAIAALAVYLRIYG